MEINKRKFLEAHCVDDDALKNAILGALSSLSDTDVERLYTYFIEVSQGRANYYITRINALGGNFSAQISTGSTFLR